MIRIANIIIFLNALSFFSIGSFYAFNYVFTANPG